MPDKPAAPPRRDRRRAAALLLSSSLWPAWPALAAMASSRAAAAPVSGPSNAQGANGAAPPDAEGAAAEGGRWVHALATFGEPKYPENFTSFEYVRPDAPKGGVLKLRNPDRRTSFDKFNPFTVRGNAPAGVSIYMFESLCTGADDEPQTMYGLLAERFIVAPDKSSITFRLDPRARFWNGDPVTAEDVKFSFERLTSKQASPALVQTYAPAGPVTVLDERTVRFGIKDRSLDTVFLVGGLPVFSRKWGLGADGKVKPFDQVVGEYPITTGAYVIDRVDMGRRIEFKRNPDYWAKEHPTRRGWFNFDRVVYRMYKDGSVAFEAFKTGEYDIHKEYSSRAWARQHKGPKWDDGRIVKNDFETATGQGLQSHQFNTRRELLSDRRVREAIALAYDFERINRFGLLKRAYSVFNNSEFAAEGLPSAGELKLLEPYRKALPPEVFGPAFRPPSTAGGAADLRRNLLKARALLEDAGWKLDGDGLLRNAQGRALELEYLNPGETGGRISDWQKNCEKLGITLKERNVDFALYRNRLENYDFDVITIVEGKFTLPNAASYITSYGSQAADEKGNGNFRGIKSPALDHILAVMSKVQTLAELRDCCRAMDRIVMWNHWQVPDVYVSAERASYWNRFGIPAKQPLYFGIDTAGENSAWPVMCWWIKDRNKEQA
ncbi:extracellular solute-binding protein [Azohydromonas lata]|uniref:extracellular solute-binding protein n=1 Tax=Azohydromonas lata TaxID=45677 RepID=UPI00082AD558|nr:extracellular solute-binding protein [Azohydromonas lata]